MGCEAVKHKANQPIYLLAINSSVVLLINAFNSIFIYSNQLVFLTQ